MRRVRRFAVALLVLSTLLPLAAACSDDPPGTYDDALQRWKDKRPDSYSFTLVSGGMVGRHETRVRVEDGVVTQPSPGPSPGRFGGDVGTIDQLFEALAREYAEADEVEATYDPTWGFPTNVDVDEETSAIDDEHSFGVEDFTVGTAAPAAAPPSSPSISHVEGAERVTVTPPRPRAGQPARYVITGVAVDGRHLVAQSTCWGDDMCVTGGPSCAEVTYGSPDEQPFRHAYRYTYDEAGDFRVGITFDGGCRQSPEHDVEFTVHVRRAR